MLRPIAVCDVSDFRPRAGGLAFTVLSGGEKPGHHRCCCQRAFHLTRPHYAWGARMATRFVMVERGTLSLYDIKTGKERNVLEMGNLDRAAVPVPAPPLFDWTNRRVAEESSIQWFSDSKRLLVAAAGRPLHRWISRRTAMTRTHADRRGRKRPEAFARRSFRLLPPRAGSVHHGDCFGSLFTV